MRKACFRYRETMRLDVLGELEPESSRAWEAHLTTCENCQRERKMLAETLESCQTAAPAPELSSQQATEMVGSVLHRLKAEKQKPTWQQWLPAKPAKLIPLMAAASLLIVALGWLNLSDPSLFSPVRTASHITPDEHQMIKDIEVIKNMELLKEMESLQKLNQMVDQPVNDDPGYGRFPYRYQNVSQRYNHHAGFMA